MAVLVGVSRSSFDINISLVAGHDAWERPHKITCLCLRFVEAETHYTCLCVQLTVSVRTTHRRQCQTCTCVLTFRRSQWKGRKSPLPSLTCPGWLPSPAGWPMATLTSFPYPQSSSVPQLWTGREAGTVLPVSASIVLLVCFWSSSASHFPRLLKSNVHGLLNHCRAFATDAFSQKTK